MSVDYLLQEKAWLKGLMYRYWGMSGMCLCIRASLYAPAGHRFVSPSADPSTSHYEKLWNAQQLRAGFQWLV